MRAVIRIQFILFATALWFSACRGADWPTFRGNFARTGFYPHTVGYPSDKPAWMISLGCEIISSPSVAGNILYIGARDSCIYAIDCSTGKIRWKRKTGGWVDASPLIDGNRVIVGSRDSTIYVLDRNSGEILGRLGAGVQLSSPGLTARGTIISGLGMPGGGLSVYDKVQGLAKGLAEPQRSIGLPQYTYSSPAIHGQAVVIGATNGRLYGIDEARMDTIWTLPTKGVIYLSTPAIDDMTVYFAPGDEDRNVYSVNLLTGKILWKREPVSRSSNIVTGLAKNASVRLLPSAEIARLLRMSPSLRKKTIRHLRAQRIVLPGVPYNNASGNNAALNKKGAVTWEFIPLDGMKTSSVTVGPNCVFVIQKNLGYLLGNDSLVDYKQHFAIYALDKSTGKTRWEFNDWRASTEHGYCSSPVATEHVVYFGWGEGRIYGLDAKSGKKLWTDTLQGHILSSPAIAGNKLFVATTEGVIYAYQLTETSPGIDFKRSTYCYPNPARGDVSHIQVYVNKPAKMTLTVYTFADNPVFKLKSDLPGGTKYVHDWKLGNVANGVYFARIMVEYVGGGKEKKTLKIAVLR